MRNIGLILSLGNRKWSQDGQKAMSPEVLDSVFHSQWSWAQQCLILLLGTTVPMQGVTAVATGAEGSLDCTQPLITSACKVCHI